MLDEFLYQFAGNGAFGPSDLHYKIDDIDR